jgi:hypothetical protein
VENGVWSRIIFVEPQGDAAPAPNLQFNIGELSKMSQTVPIRRKHKKNLP